MFFAKSTGGFYDAAIHAAIPADAVEVSGAEHRNLLAEQAAGKRIVSDANGYPVAVDPASLLTLGELKSAHIAALSAACSAHINAGFESSALGSPHTYPANARDQMNLVASVVASMLPGTPAEWTTPFWCKDSLGTWGFIPHSAAQIQQVGADGKAAIVAALARNAALADEVLLSQTDTVQKVAAIQW